MHTETFILTLCRNGWQTPALGGGPEGEAVEKSW